MDDYVYKYVCEHGTRVERDIMILWRMAKELGKVDTDKFRCLEESRQEFVEKYGLQPYEMNAYMNMPDGKNCNNMSNNNDNTINNNISVGSGTANISNSNNPKIINSNNVYNITYGNRDVNTIVNLIPEKDNKMDYNYRDMLCAIHLKTRTVYHKFTGFINKKCDRKVYLCNIFWNKKVYVCDHVVIFNKPECINKLEVGDYVEFIGEIENYTRSKSKKEDMGLKILNIIKVTKPNLKVEVAPVRSMYYETQDISYLTTLSNDQLNALYQDQLSSIGYASTRFLTENYPVEVYMAMMQSVYYEVTREYDMVKDRLEIDGKIDVGFVKFACFTKFLVCDNMVLSPFVVYNILCCAINRTPNKILNDKFYNNIRKYAASILEDMGVDIKNILSIFDVYLSNTIGSIRTAIEHPCDENNMFTD